MWLNTLIINTLFLFSTSVSSAVVFQKAKVTANIHYASIEVSKTLLDQMEFEIRYAYYGLKQKPICKIFYKGTEIEDSGVFKACSFTRHDSDFGSDYWVFSMSSLPVVQTNQLSEPLRTKFINLYKKTVGTDLDIEEPWNGVIQNPSIKTEDLYDDVNPEAFMIVVTLHPSSEI